MLVNEIGCSISKQLNTNILVIFEYVLIREMIVRRRKPFQIFYLFQVKRTILVNNVINFTLKCIDDTQHSMLKLMYGISENELKLFIISDGLPVLNFPAKISSICNIRVPSDRELTQLQIFIQRIFRDIRGNIRLSDGIGLSFAILFLPNFDYDDTKAESSGFQFKIEFNQSL